MNLVKRHRLCYLPGSIWARNQVGHPWLREHGGSLLGKTDRQFVVTGAPSKGHVWFKFGFRDLIHVPLAVADWIFDEDVRSKATCYIVTKEDGEPVMSPEHSRKYILPNKKFDCAKTYIRMTPALSFIAGNEQLRTFEPFEEVVGDENLLPDHYYTMRDNLSALAPRLWQGLSSAVLTREFPKWEAVVYRPDRHLWRNLGLLEGIKSHGLKMTGKYKSVTRDGHTRAYLFEKKADATALVLSGDYQMKILL
jgi:hypothetical protein